MRTSCQICPSDFHDLFERFPWKCSNNFAISLRTGGTAGMEDRELEFEIRFWLNRSEDYLQSFKIAKDSGPIWFLIDGLLRATDGQYKVGTANLALDSAGKPCAPETLAKYIDILVDAELVVQPPKTSPRKYPMGAVLMPGPKMEDCVSEYTKRILEALFAGYHLKESNRYVMREIYAFMGQFVSEWEMFLRGIARVSVEGTTGDAINVFQYLRGTSEAFVAFLAFWNVHLGSAGFKDGIKIETRGKSFEISERQKLAHGRMQASPNIDDLHGHLIDKGIIKPIDDKGNSYELAGKYHPVFDAYAPIFKKMSAGLLLHLQTKVPSLGGARVQPRYLIT